MRLFHIIVLLTSFGFSTAFAQRSWTHKKKFGTQKNAMYFYWGYNRSVYTPSTIKFWGPQYNFTANKVRAKDRPEKNIATYVNPRKITIPQFSVRLGWYYKFRWDWSIGYDHMKYVMRPGQTLVLNGVVEGTTSSTLSGTYTDSDGEIPILEEDLHYENTNGLNYVSVQLNNTAPIYKTKNLKFAIQRRLGAGAGIVLVQTDFIWDGQEYNSTPKVGGYGLSLHGGVRFDFFNRFFLQSNLASGFIHLPKNATIQDQGHYAKHKFVFLEWDVVAGLLFYLKTKNDCDSCPDWH